MDNTHSTPPQPIRRVSIATQVALQLIIATFLLGVVNYLSYRHFRRWDLTLNQDYSVSDQTRSYLKSLRGKTEIIAVFPKGDPEEEQVRKLLEEYKRHAKSKLSISYLDLTREPSRLLDARKKYQINLQGPGLIVSKKVPAPKAKPGEKEPEEDTIRRVRFIDAADMFTYEGENAMRRITSFRGEDLLSTAIISVNQSESPVIYLLKHNVASLPAAEVGDGEERRQVTAENVIWDIAAKQDAHVRPLYLSHVAEIPEDASAIISLRASRDFTEREIEMLEAYWTKRKGAALLFLLDPDATKPRLEGWLAKYGVQPRDDRVLTTVTTAQGTRKETEVLAAFVPDTPITKRLGEVVLNFPEQSQSLRVEENSSKLRENAITVTPLAFAGADYWGETRYFEPDPRPDSRDTRPPEPLWLAAAVERGAQHDERLSANSSRMVVIGNAALLDPSRDGLARVDFTARAFVTAALNWTMNREELLGIPSRYMPGYHLSLTPQQTRKIFGLCLGLFPAAVLALALAMWSARRA